MRINLRIKYLTGEEKEITCSASDLVKFEDKFNISIAKIEQDLKITYLLFLAWCSETRTKAVASSFEDWTDLVESVGASEAKDPK